MTRVNPLVFPDPQYVQEFTPPPAEDGTVISKTWYWVEATSSQDTGHWELRTPEIKEMSWTARKPLVVYRKSNTAAMSTDEDFNPYSDTIVYALDVDSIAAASYSYEFDVSWYDGYTQSPPVDRDYFVISGYHNPRLVLIRGNKYTFHYKDALPFEMYFHNEVRRNDRTLYNLFEDGVVRNDRDNSVTFTVPGDAPPKLLYGPQPDGFAPGRSGEIAIEDNVQL